MKILFITQEFTPTIGGVARYYAGLVGALVPPHDVTVLAPSTGYVNTAPYTVLRRRFEWKWVWPRWLPLLCNTWRAIRRYHPDEVWVGQVLPVGTVVWLLRQLAIRHMRYAVFTHGMDILLPQSSPRKRALMKRILQGASRVVANSSFVRDELVKLGVPESHIVILHPCVEKRSIISDEDILAFRAQKGVEGKKVVLTVARLVRRKGVDLLLCAFQQVNDSNTVLVVVGGGPEHNALEQYAIGNKLPVRFAGEVSDDELSSWYAACDIFALTPRRIGPDVEGFGMVYLEAGQYGKPVIGTRSGGVPDAVVDGETGLLVDEDDLEGLTAALRRLLTDTELRTRLGTNARARIEREFRWESQVQKLW